MFSRTFLGLKLDSRLSEVNTQAIPCMGAESLPSLCQVVIMYQCIYDAVRSAIFCRHLSF